MLTRVNNDFISTETDDVENSHPAGTNIWEIIDNKKTRESESSTILKEITDENQQYSAYNNMKRSVICLNVWVQVPEGS